MMNGQRERAQVPPKLTTLQIGMTAARFGRGGLDRYFFSLIRALPAHGVEVRGLVAGVPDDLEPDDGATCFAPENVGLIARGKAMRRVLPRQLPATNLVVSHFAPYAFPVLDKLRRRPFVVHFHGPWAAEGAQEGASAPAILAKRVLERLVYARAARVIVLSRAFATIVEHDYGVRPEIVRIVPGGVDLARFSAPLTRRDARLALDWPTDRPIVLSVRRLVRAKGIDNLIEALAEIRRAVPDVLLVIGGTGPLEAALKRRVAELQLERWVRFVGFIPEDALPTMYRAADLFVVPTVALEGFGLVVIEALACGTPALVTPVAGLPEVVSDLDSRLILPGAKSEHLARGISDALTGALPLPSDAACIAYAQRFGWSTIAGRVADVYREVV